MDSFWLLIKFLIAAIIMAAIVIVLYGELADIGMTSGQKIMVDNPEYQRSNEGLIKPPRKQSW